MTADGMNQYTYDAEGNLIQEITPSGTVKYTYDALNEQVRTDYGSGTPPEAVFNLSGQLVSLWLAGGTSPLMGKAYWGQTAVESYQTGHNMAYFQYRDWVGTLRSVVNGQGTVTDHTGSLHSVMAT
jgi:YD repeat-containing protein